MTSGDAGAHPVASTRPADGKRHIDQRKAFLTGLSTAWPTVSGINLPRGSAMMHRTLTRWENKGIFRHPLGGFYSQMQRALRRREWD